MIIILLETPRAHRTFHFFLSAIYFDVSQARREYCYYPLRSALSQVNWS
jgi:hypothetical protein